MQEPDEPRDDYLHLRFDVPMLRSVYDRMSAKDRVRFLADAQWAAGRFADPGTVFNWRIEQLRLRVALTERDIAIKALEDVRTAFLATIRPADRPDALKRALRRAYDAIARSRLRHEAEPQREEWAQPLSAQAYWVPPEETP